MDFINRLKNTSNNAIIIVLIIGILALVNFIFLNHFVRLDLTEENRYTLADATKETMRNLDDTVTIKAFFSTKLPPDLVNLTREIKDVLDEFAAYSDNNLQVRFLDPADDPKWAEEAAALGVPELDMNIVEKDKVQLQKGYLGIAIIYEDKTEVLPIVQSTYNLEYDLTAAIKKVTATELKKVGFLTGHGEHAIMETGMGTADYTILKQALEKNYTVTTVTSDKAITDIDTLVVAGPKGALSDRDLYEIDQFVMNGGNVIFLVDTVLIDQGLQASVLEVNLSGLLAYWGIKVKPELAVDVVNEMASFQTGYLTFMTQYPFWLKLINENFDQGNPILAKLESLSLPWASPLEQVSGDSGLQLTILAKTTDQAWSKVSPFNLDPQQTFAPTGETQALPMAALISGKAKSYFADKGVPQKEKMEEVEGEMKAVLEEPSEEDKARETLKESVSENKIMVVGDSDFVSDGFARQFPANLDFMLNAIDYLTLDSALIGIRAKRVIDRPLTEISEGKKSMVKIAGVWLVPILIGGYGIFRNIRRRKMKRNL